MKIQSKVILIGTAMLVTTLLALTLFSIIILQPSYAALEQGNTITEMDRGISLLQNNLEELESTLNDWAFWDDTYQFARGKNPTYPSSNLMKETFSNLNLNGLLIYDRDGNLVYAQGFNLTTDAYADLPVGLNASIAAHHETLFSGTNQQIVNGTLLLPGGPVMIAAAPILTSTFSGPPDGTMMMVRSLDQRWLNQISSDSGIPVSIMITDQIPPDPDLSKMAPLLGRGEPVALPVNDAVIRGYQMIPCLDRDGGFILSVDNTRTITRTGAATIDGYLKIIGLSGVLFALFTIYLIRKNFISRLNILTTGVLSAEQGDCRRKRIEKIRGTMGDDELTVLGTAINRMLDTIDRAQAATEASEERYRSVIEDQTELICRVDAIFTITFMNRAFKDYFVAGRAKGQNILTLFPMMPEPVKERVMLFLKGLTPDEPVGETEIMFQFKGDTRWAALTVRGLFDASGAVTEYQFVGRDVTAQKQALIELKEYRDHLEELVDQRSEEMMGMQEELLNIERLESIGVLAGGIAHDFNNLLSAILGNIELVRMDLDEDSPLDERMAEMERVVLRATALTRQLLTFAKGGAPIRRMTHLGPMIKDTVEFTCRGSPVRCSCRIPDDLWITEVDHNQISQVINNIVLNAVQAMPNGGTLGVTAENREYDGGEAVPLPAGRYVKITLTDDGPGIPAEQVSRIFDPFFTTKTAGSGLGLSTSFSIIRQHNGLLLVASTPGEGTTFTILIPAAANGDVPAEE
jgi:PAS domain S-box-containing protein